MLMLLLEGIYGRNRETEQAYSDACILMVRLVLETHLTCAAGGVVDIIVVSTVS
jgi:hypothetical protein